MKTKYLVLGAVGVLVAAVTAVGIWTFPLWHTAYHLYQLSKAKSLNCQINVSLEEGDLPENAVKFLHAVSWALGMEDSAILEWKVSGQLSEGKGRLEIYCDGAEEPVTEVYFEQDRALVNVGMLYRMIQDSFKKEHPLMGAMFPDWKYGEYLSLEQIQEIFQIDLKDMFQKDSSLELAGHSYWEFFLLLRGIDRKKTERGGWQFGMQYKDYQIAFETGKDEQTPYLFVRGVGQKDQTLRDASATLFPGQETEIHVPTSLMKQEEVAQFQKLWFAVAYLIEGRK